MERVDLLSSLPASLDCWECWEKRALGREKDMALCALKAGVSGARLGTGCSAQLAAAGRSRVTFSTALLPGSRRFLASTSSLPSLELSKGARREGPWSIRASSDAAAAVRETREKVGPLQSLLNAIAHIWKQIVQPLGNFGFGKRSIWEGGVGLFLVTGVFMLALLLGWIRGLQLQGRTEKYRATVEFAQACGITVGTPVRIRGVSVGTVVGVQPSLAKINVEVEVGDATVVIPRNALVEVNQSGLISETLIDITPQPPLPKPTVGPLSPHCAEEGLIVCDRGHIVGQQGVSLDELVGICTKLARQMDKGGMENVFDAMNRVSSAVEDARPLLDKVTQMSSDLQPLMKDLRDGELLRNLESLTKVATETANDLRSLNSSVLSGENTKLLRQSVATLSRTLEHIESISSDVRGLTGDSSTQHNLRQLIESLSRLVND